MKILTKHLSVSQVCFDSFLSSETLSNAELSLLSSNDPGCIKNDIVAIFKWDEWIINPFYK